MINIHNLEFFYKESGFHLTIPELVIDSGKKIAVQGPSGCGKTTFLRLLAGIHTPQKGTVTIDEEDISRLPDAKRRSFRSRRIGFIFQEFELLDYLSVLENILLPFRISRALRFDADVRERAVRLISELGMTEKIKQRPANLSQGEKQRVAIGRALIARPRILLADEPTGNLDPKNKQHIKSLLFEQASQTGATLIFITHDHSLLSDFDRVIDFEGFVRGEVG